jgi:RND superfamily putative drug exporter
VRSLTRLVLAHKALVVLTWLLLAVAGVATISTTTGRLTADFALPGQPGYVANARIQALYHSGGAQQPTVVMATVPAGVAPRSPQAVAAAARIFAAAGAVVPGARVADQANTGDAKLATADGRTQFALVFTAPVAQFGGADPTAAIPAAAARAAPAGWKTAVTGFGQLQNGNSGSGGTGVLAETLIGGVGALLVLAFVFASFLAVLPLLMAAVAIPVTFLLVLGLTAVTPVSFIVEFLIALIGLGVAIDYALLIVTRWREEVAAGADNDSAVIRAMGHAGRAVMFSGLTVAISLLALVVLPVPFLRNIGVAGFFIPLVSIAVATTLLPVLLATIGPAIDRPQIRHEGTVSRPWAAWARLVLAHRRIAAVIGAAILAALVVPLLSIRLGEPSTAALAQSGPAHQALAQLEAGGVPSGVLLPLEVQVRDGSAAAVAAKVTGVAGVHTVIVPAGPAWHQGGTAMVEVLPTAEVSSSAGNATVSAVRAALKGDPRVIGVGGVGPVQADFISAVYGSFPLMLSLIGLATLILLTRAFRSIVLAAKAVVFNLLSVAAAYGTIVLIWQQGHGSQAIWGVPATGAITIWVPVMIFAFLFGLSMDYEVFILSRIREEYDATASTSTAVITGIGRTGRLVTSAALILCLAFVSLSSAPGTDTKILATGLGAGILLDAVVVRCLLVPALVGILGRYNWWLPAGLAKVLRVPASPLPSPAPGPGTPLTPVPSKPASPR